MPDVPALMPQGNGKVKLTLHDLLNIMERRDDSEVWELFRDDEPEDLAELTRDKIDGYHEVIEQLEQDAERLKARAKAFREMADIQERKAARVQNRLRFTMRSHQCERLPGNDFNAVMGARRQLVIRQPQLTMEDFMRFPKFVSVGFKWKREPSIDDDLQYPDLIERTYQWDKEALRQAFKNGTAPEELRGLADYEEQETFKWEVRKKL